MRCLEVEYPYWGILSWILGVNTWLWGVKTCLCRTLWGVLRCLSTTYKWLKSVCRCLYSF